MVVLELFQFVGFAAHWAQPLLALVEFLLALVVVFSGEAYHFEVAQGAFLQSHVGYVEYRPKRRIFFAHLRRWCVVVGMVILSLFLVG